MTRLLEQLINRTLLHGTAGIQDIGIVTVPRDNVEVMAYKQEGHVSLTT
jgi:hypothetical protein